jgi:PD-(D/E)XK nuclease superfamily
MSSKSATKMAGANAPLYRGHLDAVARFLDLVRALRVSSARPATERVADFFDKIGKFRKQSAPEMPPKRFAPKVTPAAWTAFISKFRPLYEEERRKGSFLNVWEVAGLGRNETRNAGVLAWLLNASSTHGRDAAILHGLLQQLDPSEKVPFLARSAWSGAYTVEIENYPGDLESRVDIVLQSSRALIFMEVKIDSEEGANQVFKYLELARAKKRVLSLERAGVIYLTKVGAPDPTIGVSDEVIHASWRHVQRAIETATYKKRNWADRVLIQFAQHIGHF